MIDPIDNGLSLDELSDEVTRRLEHRGLLNAQTDHRVSAVPDARTIRYYTSLGLLDRPTVAGRQARYGPRHVLQLLAIKALQGASLPLADIQSRLYGRSNAELEALLVALSQLEHPAPTAVKAVRWIEVAIEPGLKIMIEEDWSPKSDTETLARHIQAALEALKSAPPGSERRKNI